jgi:ribosome assembly protein YihI (activator of Der GTPase)
VTPPVEKSREASQQHDPSVGSKLKVAAAVHHSILKDHFGNILQRDIDDLERKGMLPKGNSQEWDL